MGGSRGVDNLVEPCPRAKPVDKARKRQVVHAFKAAGARKPPASPKGAKCRHKRS